MQRKNRSVRGNEWRFPAGPRALTSAVVVVFLGPTSNSDPRWGFREADHGGVSPAKSLVYSFNSPGGGDLATLTTALSVPRNPWFVRSTRPALFIQLSLSLSMEDLATLTTALSDPRNPWFVHSTRPALFIQLSLSLSRWRISRR